MTDSATLAPVNRTTDGLKTVLLDELDAFRGGQSNPSHANTIIRAVSGVVEVLNTELNIKKYLAGQGRATDTSLGAPIQLTQAAAAAAS